MDPQGNLSLNQHEQRVLLRILDFVLELTVNQKELYEYDTINDIKVKTEQLLNERSNT